MPVFPRPRAARSLHRDGVGSRSSSAIVTSEFRCVGISSRDCSERTTLEWRQARAIDLGGLRQEGPDATGSYTFSYPDRPDKQCPMKLKCIPFNDRVRPIAAARALEKRTFADFAVRPATVVDTTRREPIDTRPPSPSANGEVAPDRSQASPATASCKCAGNACRARASVPRPA
jgi:hypothetical protein